MHDHDNNHNNDDIKNAPQTSNILQALKKFVLGILPLVIIFVFSVAYFVLVYVTGETRYSLLGTTFLVYLPFTLGALVAYTLRLATKSRKGTYIYITGIIFCSFLVCTILFGEGIICIIIASPILIAMMAVGAEVMHLICKLVWKNNKIFSIALIPFVAFVFPHNESLYDQHKSYSIIINAPPETIWASINNIDNINPDEMVDSWGAKIGIPTPISAFTVSTDETTTGLVRKCKWRKDVWFDEPITEFVPNKRLSWYFKFYPESVPSGALDDHVTINGEHFKLNTASYDLERIGDNQTKLTFSLNYQVITDMNWYSGWWADFFMDDFADSVLKLYKNRAENSTAPTDKIG